VAMSANCYNVTFQNVKWNNIGEHGVYTHCSQGYLRFIDCIFQNCSQSPRVAQLRNGGISACVRPAINKNENLTQRTLKLYFEGCTFSNDGDLNVLTCYGGGTYYEYRNCTWSGNIQGYTETTGVPQALGRCTEHVFYNCTNPMTRYSGYNTRRRLYSCRQVANLFSDLVEAENCVCLFRYSDVNNKYSEEFLEETKTPVVVKNCTMFSDSKSLMARIKIQNPRPMVIEDCRFIINDDSLSGNIIYVDSDENVSVAIRNTDFDISGMRFLNAAKTSVTMESCNIKSCRNYLISTRKANAQIKQENCNIKEGLSIQDLK